MSGKLALALLAMGALVPLRAAPQSINYVDSSTADKLEGRWNLQLGAPGLMGLALDADMRLIGEDGQTRASPRIKSSWSVSEHLDVKTVMDYGNLNAAATRPKIDTTIVFDSGLSFVDRIEATVQRADSATRRPSPPAGKRAKRRSSPVSVRGISPKPRLPSSTTPGRRASRS